MKAIIRNTIKIFQNYNCPNKIKEQLAQLIPLKSNTGNAFRFGTLQGQIKVADDFDAPLPDDVLDLFETDL